MGRHIDADLVYNAIQITSDKFGILKTPIEGVFRSMLSEIPTVEECKKGEWSRHPSVNGLIDDVRCSCCNSNPPVMSVNVSWGWNLTKFCPNCGAYMRGESNNG